MNDSLLTEIKNCAEKIIPRVIKDRRHLHSYPELSFQEYQTSAFIKSRLDEMNVSWRSMANTGVVAIIEGEKASGKVVALRADIDALPIAEANDVTYSSKNKDVMHACGHDAHTASLLGAAKILQTVKSKFGGTVKLIFQPAEEILPGGASLMIKEGALQNPAPHAMLGQHVSPGIPVGKIAVRKGKFMASMDEIFVTVRGKGGHGAQPHLNVDPVMISAQILITLQQLVSRIADPAMPTVLSFGKVIANGTINVIPDQVYMEGTFRTMDETWRREAHRRMKQIAQNIAESMGGTCEFNITQGYPYLVNEEKLAEQVRQFASDYIGHENVLNADIWMAAEDFAYYSHEVTSCFYLLGVGNSDKEIGSSLHNPTFNIDEDALGISTGLMAYMAIKQLGN